MRLKDRILQSGVWKYAKKCMKVLRGQKLYKQLLQKAVSVNILLICPYAGGGDAWISCIYMDEYLSRHNLKKSDCVVIVDSNISKKIFCLFQNIKCFQISVKEMDDLLAFYYLIEDKTKNMKMLHYSPLHHTSIMNYVQGMHHIDFLKIFSEIGLEVKKTGFSIPDSIYCYEDNVQLKNKYFIEENKTVILAPYANSMNLPIEFWNYLTSELLKMGLLVYTNCNSDQQVLPDTERIFFDLADASSLLRKAGFFIAARSGLCDLVSVIPGYNKFIIYPQNLKWGAATADEFFSLKKMGLCNDAIELTVSVNDYIEPANIILRQIGEKIMPHSEYIMWNKNHQYSLSIIVPAYNTGDYIERCLMSILNQTKRDLEIIVINNGSQDNTEEVVKKVQEKDSRVKIFTLAKNQGPSGARNEGMKHATGKYIAFCDSDDFVPPYAYSLLTQQAEIDGSDVVVGNFRDIVGENVQERNIYWHGSEVVAFFGGGAVWNKIYRNSFIKKNKIEFEPYKFGEDTLFLGRVYSNSPKVSSIKDSIYDHIDRIPNKTEKEHFEVQLTRQYNFENFNEYIQSGIITYTLKYKCAPNDLYVEYNRYLSYLYFFWGKISVEEGQEEAFIRLKDFVRIMNWDDINRINDFISTFQVTPYMFLRLNYQSYLLALCNNQHNHGSNQIVRPFCARDIVAEEFKHGLIGFRFIAKYAKYWIKYKLFGQGEN